MGSIDATPFNLPHMPGKLEIFITDLRDWIEQQRTLAAAKGEDFKLIAEAYCGNCDPFVVQLIGMTGSLLYLAGSTSGGQECTVFCSPDSLALRFRQRVEAVDPPSRPIGFLGELGTKAGS